MVAGALGLSMKIFLWLVITLYELWSGFMCLCEIYLQIFFCSLGNLFVGNLYGIVFLEMKYVGSSVIEYLEGVG